MRKSSNLVWLLVSVITFLLGVVAAVYVYTKHFKKCTLDEFDDFDDDYDDYEDYTETLPEDEAPVHKGDDDDGFILKEDY